MTKARHVIVVGAGPGGLTSAALLAKAGVRVTVVERLPHVGGRTSNFVAKGFRFDHGPTFFHYPQVLDSILSSIGYDLWHELNLIRLDPHYRLVFGGGGEILATPAFEKMASEIARICPGDAAHLHRFLADNREKLRLFRPFLESSFDSWRDTVKPSLMRILPTLRPWRSLDSELRRYFSDQRVRLAFSFQSKYLGMSPFECPGLFTILSFLEYEYGVFHPVGGCGSVTSMLARIACQLGAKLQLDTPVLEVLTSGRRAIGVRTPEGSLHADAVVINGDFARAIPRLIPQHLRPGWSDRKLSKKRLSCSAFMLYLGVRGTYDRLSHHTVYIAKDYMKNMSEIERRHVLSDDPSYYLQNASVTDTTLAPKGKSTLYVLAPVTNQQGRIDWKKEGPRYRELLLDKLEALGAHGIRDRIEYERMITPDDWDSGFEIHQGAIFGLAHNWSQMLHLRPRNRFDQLDGVYLVGGSTHPGSGLPVIFESARISSRLLLNDLGLPANWDHSAPAPLLADTA